MSRDNLNNYLALNEIANFKGTHRRFADFEETLQNKFGKTDVKRVLKKFAAANKAAPSFTYIH